MAHKSAAIKHIRQAKKRTANNIAVKKNIAYLRKQAMKAVEAKDKEKAAEFMAAMVKAVDKAARVNVLKKNNAARKKSRLAKVVNAIAK